MPRIFPMNNNNERSSLDSARTSFSSSGSRTSFSSSETRNMGSASLDNHDNKFRTITCNAICTTKELAKKAGEYFDIDDTYQILRPIDGNIEVRVEHERLLLKVVRNAIPLDICETARKCFECAANVQTTNRGHSAGSIARNEQGRFERSLPAESGIVGYIDSRIHSVPCRATAFTQKHMQEFKEGLPFIRAIDKCFSEAVPDSHTVQLAEASRCGEYHIDGTAFTTVTVNRNWRTALHVDSGDFRKGFGNLVVYSDGIQGGYLMFPRYKIAVEMSTGDFMAMDVHEWHCNSQIDKMKADALRLAFVCYMRPRMVGCADINRRLDITGVRKLGWFLSEIFGESIPEPYMNESGGWKRESERYILTYSSRRYYMLDKATNTTIYNLYPAWEYVQKQKVEGTH